jgi:hypothetical protein
VVGFVVLTAAKGGLDGVERARSIAKKRHARR